MLRRIILSAIVLVGCSPGAAPVSRSTNDPSSPSAPAGRDPLLAAADVAPTAKAREHDHGHGHGHDHAATVYACPMHPEITSDKPDQLCPKCNMKLVPTP